MKPRIGLDIDGVLANFLQGFINAARLEGLGSHFPKTWREWTSHLPKGEENCFGRVWDLATPRHSFWLGLEPLMKPSDIPFGPTVYCTARPAPTRVTMSWLYAHGFPEAEVITVPYGANKMQPLKEAEVDYFVDDNATNYRQINSGGRTQCFLWDTPANQDAPVSYQRISYLWQVPDVSIMRYDNIAVAAK